MRHRPSDLLRPRSTPSRFAPRRPRREEQLTDPPPVARRRPRGRAIALALMTAAVLGLLVWLGARSGPSVSQRVALPDTPVGEEAALLAALAEAKPGDADPARRLGEHYLAMGRPFAALWQYAAALDVRPEDVPAALGMGRALEAALLPDAAIERIRALPGPNDAGARLQLADLLLRTGRPEAALETLRPLLPASAEEPGLAVLEGRVRQALGDREGARRAYRAAVEDPKAKDPAPWRRLGLLELERGDLFNARQAFGAARVLASRQPGDAVDFGRAYAASAKPEEEKQALKYYVEAMNMNLRFAPAHLEAGRWYSRHRRWREAIERLRFALDVQPGSAEAHEALAVALEAVGQRAEAHRHRGIALDLRDLRAPALREFQAWAALAPNDMEADLEIAQAHFRLNQRVEARERLKKARQRFGDQPILRERLIAMSLLLGDREPVWKLTEEWLRAEPGAPRALWLQGRAAFEEQRYADAVRLYEEALKRVPENAEYLGALGESLLKLPGSKAVPRAVEVLARAAGRQPEEKRWRIALAEALQRSGRIPEARRQCLRALDLHPLLASGYFLAARLASAEGARGAAALFADLVRRVEARLREETPLFEATWKRPDDPRPYLALADFLIRHGDLESAEGQLAHAARLQPTPENRARLARVQRLLAVQ